MLTAGMLVTACLLSACAMLPFAGRQQQAARQPTQDQASASTQPSLSMAALHALNKARARVARAKQLLPHYTDSDELLQEAVRAADGAKSEQTKSLALEVINRVDVDLNEAYGEKAQAALDQASRHTAMSDHQYDLLRAARAQETRGNVYKAYHMAERLNTELARNKQVYRVKKGDTLSQIAAKPQIYANAYMWPLIYKANKSSIANPDHIRVGQRLKILMHPMVDAVYGAVEYARKRGAWSVAERRKKRKIFLAEQP